MLSKSRFFLPFLLLVLVAGCDSTSEEGITTFIGTIVDGGSDEPLEGATVNVVGTGQTARTDANGFFSLVVEADSTGDMIPLQVFARGYNERTLEVPAVIDQEITMPDIVLQSRSGNGGDSDGDGGDGDGDNGGVDGGADEPSGPAASITLLTRSSEAIGVQSAGADETATLTFVVLDAFGNPVDTEHAVDVSFSIASGPGGGEFIAPAVKTTNASGRVQATISSGIAAGTIQVLATATAGDGTVIRSFPVVIVIHGGLPDEAHFSVGPAAHNFPGYTRYGLENTITAIVGDIYANPVQPGTAVYFTTNAGIIQGSDLTDDLGRASVQLISAEPLSTGTPPAACPDSNVNGYAVVSARTADMNQQMIEKQTSVLFSGESEIELTEANAGADGLGSYRFVVDDAFGHPLSAGTKIDVLADGVNVEAVGDIDVVLGDYLCPGPGRTEFGIAVVEGDEIDEDHLPLPPQLETITITVQSMNGNLQLTLFNENGARRVVVEKLDA